MTKETIKLGNWEIILTTTLIIPEGEEAQILLTPSDPLLLKIRFETSIPKENESKKTTLAIIGEGDDGVLLFENWDSLLETATGEPLEFARDKENRSIALICSAIKMDKCHKVFLQFMREEKS